MHKVKLKEFTQIVNGSTPSTRQKEYYDGDIVWITPKDLSDQKKKYIECGARKITQEGYDSCSTEMIPANNILLTTRAPIGLIAINKVDCCTNQGFKSLIINQDICTTEYLYYYLKYHIAEIEALGSGTTFKEVSKRAIENYEVFLPNISEQKKVCKILSALDSKIDNNNAIIAELESLAKDIYDYWFVQFDFPNENGKPYKSSGGKMVWNEALKREIPEDWKVVKLEEIISFQKGKIPNGELTDESNAENTTPYITIEVANGFNPKYCNPNGLVTLNGETIMVMDGAASGDVYLGNFGILGSTFSKICSKKNDFSDSLIYMILNHFSAVYKKANTGSTVPHANSRYINQLRIAVPLNCMFASDKFNIIFKAVLNYKKEIHELLSLRDFLLPLLMNGQVTVGGSDK